jgi:CRP-like cAMP-binding protein
LAPQLLAADWERGQVLQRPGEHLTWAWFPETAVVSLRVVLGASKVVEVATVGREGFLGQPAVLGDAAATMEAVVQVPGSGLGLPLAVFQAVVGRSGALRQLILRATRAFVLQVALGAACNRLHGAEARLARWLLMTHDRVGADDLRLTHEFLGEMLGTTRATATLSAGALQRAGLVRTGSGRITVVDRAGLEAMACECYQAIRAEYERLLGPEAVRSKPQAGVEPNTLA